MKKGLLLLLALLLTGQTAFADVATTSDAVEVLQEKVEIDINHDEKSDEEDAEGILRYIAGEITPDPITVSFSSEGQDVPVGDTITLSAQAQGGFGTLTYRYEVVPEEGEAVVLVESTTETSVTVSCETACEGTLTLTVTDMADQSVTAQGGHILIRPVFTDANGQFTYYESESGIVIKAWLDTEATQAFIPDTINGAAVTEIAPSAFENMEKLAAVRLPDTISVIGKAAFKNCAALASMHSEG